MVLWEGILDPEKNDKQRGKSINKDRKMNQEGLSEEL